MTRGKRYHRDQFVARDEQTPGHLREPLTQGPFREFRPTGPAGSCGVISGHVEGHVGGHVGSCGGSCVVTWGHGWSCGGKGGHVELLEHIDEQGYIP